MLKSQLHWSDVIIFDFIIKVILLWVLLYCLNFMFTGVSIYNGITYILSLDETPEEKAKATYALTVYWTEFRKMLFGWNITEFSVWVPVFISSMMIYFLNLFHVFAVNIWQPSKNRFIQAASKSNYLSENAPIEALIKTGCLCFGSIYLSYTIPYKITKYLIS